jgi:CRP/FNR family transcriptional regulator
MNSLDLDQSNVELRDAALYTQPVKRHLRLINPLPLPAGTKLGPSPCAACTARVLSVCNAIDDSGLDRLAATVTTQKAEAQRPIIVEGEQADAFLNITEGIVKVYKLLADGRQQIIGFLFAGDFVGLSSNETYAYSAEAITAVSYCRFPRRQLERLLDDFPQMERRLLRIASNELAAAQQQMLLLGRKSARERLASFLLMLSHQAERVGGVANPVQLPMTRRDIADYLGLTIETVSRTFTQLRKEKIIDMRRPNEVDLIDRAELEDVGGAS